MATAAKPKNGTVNVETVVTEMATEAKAAVDAVLETAAKVNENGLSMLNAQQKMMKDGFELWQKYNQVYFDFFLDTTRKSVDQSLAFRRELTQVLENSFKQAQEIFSDEQKLMLEAAEAMQAQTQAATERVSQMMSPVFEK
ncbi:MAG: hypothetical protein KDI30_00045 [Pseudomonadales bacterium]|nr:hypothetical protein [Pseudomonadales bacterium]